MTPKKQKELRNVVHKFGWICNTCGTIQWYKTKSIRNTEVNKHTVGICSDTVFKCDSQDVPSRSSQVR